MMSKLIALLIAVTCGFQSTLLLSRLFFWTSDALAHQSKPATLGASIHLDPNDMPQAGQASLTWFLLTRSNGSLVTPENCNCQVAVYDSKNQLVTHNQLLSTITLTAYKQITHRAISTHIVFPDPGDYTVVLAGRSIDGSFEPFVLDFPVLVHAQRSIQ